GFVGLLLGTWLTALLTKILPEGVPRVDSIVMDRVVALPTIAAALVTGILFGILPALQASHTDNQSALKQGGARGGTGGGRTFGTSALRRWENSPTRRPLARAG